MMHRSLISPTSSPESRPYKHWKMWVPVHTPEELQMMRAPLHLHKVGAPFEQVAMDIFGPLLPTHQGNWYILIIMDYTKWLEAYALPNQ